MRGIVVAAVIALGAIVTAPIAAEAASDAPDIAMAKRLMKYTGDTDEMRANVPHIARLEAEHFASGADGADVAINQKALDRAVRLQVKKYTPQFVNADAQAFTKVYSMEELKQYVDWYKKRESRRGKLPKTLADKDAALAQARTDMLTPLQPKLTQDLFTTYCATNKVTCGDAVQKLASGYGHL